MSKNCTDRKSLNEYASDIINSIPSELQIIFEIFWSHQKEVYIVGGAVRNCLLGFPVKDFDIATNVHPKQVEKLLNDVGIKTRQIGSKYGTILAIVGKKAVFDVSTFRREIYSVSAPPKIVFVDSLEEDLARRDFRFNAIAFDPKNKEFIDKYDGFNDIQRGRIRIIGDAYTRLSEDGTRIIRLARFASQYNLTIQHELLTATLAIGKNIQFYSYTALQKEFFKLLMLPDPTRGLHLLWDTETLFAMFPNFPFLKSKAEGVNIQKILHRFTKIPSRDIWIKLFGLLLFLSKESVHNADLWYLIGQNLKITVNEQKKLDRLLFSWLNFPQFFEPKKLKQWIRATGLNTSEDLLQLIFLQAELVNHSELLLKKRLYLREAQKIIESFRRRSRY